MTFLNIIQWNRHIENTGHLDNKLLNNLQAQCEQMQAQTIYILGIVKKKVSSKN